MAGGQAEAHGVVVFFHGVEDGLFYAFSERFGVVVDLGEAADDG